MPICAPGTSQPKGGYQRLVYVTAGAIEGALVGNGVSRAMAAAISGLIAGQTYDLANICAVDPPADPVLTVADFANALNWADPIAWVQAVGRIRQWFLRWYWYFVCECSGTVIPTQPALTLPTDLTENPGLPTGPTTGPCWDVSQVITFAANSGNEFAGGWDLAPFLLPGLRLTGMTGDGLYTQAAPIPSGVTTCHYTATTTMTPVGNANNQGGIMFFTAAKALISNTQLYNAPASFDGEIAVPATAAYWMIYQNTPAGNGPMHYTGRFFFFCSGQPSGGVNTPCCPPDAATLAIAQQILGLTTLIQRQVAPFAYILGAAHAGLSGSGHFAVQGLLGMKIVVTTMPTNVGQEIGDSPELWEAGWLNWVNGDGASARIWISTSPMVTIPTSAGQYTLFSYTLRPGTVITATELVRER